MDTDGPASHVATLLQQIHQTCSDQDVPHVSYAPGIGGTEGDQSHGFQPGPRSCCCSGHLADGPPHPSQGQLLMQCSTVLLMCKSFKSSLLSKEV